MNAIPTADIALDWSAYQQEIVLQNQGECLRTTLTDFGPIGARIYYIILSTGSFFQGSDVCCSLSSPDCAVQVQSQVCATLVSRSTHEHS